MSRSVHQSKNLEELYNLVIEASPDSGVIEKPEGGSFIAEHMARNIRMFGQGSITEQHITRSFGLRAQAVYLKSIGRLES